MQSLYTALQVVFALSLLFVAHADIPSDCTIHTPQLAEQPRVEFCAHESLDTFQNYTNLYNSHGPYSTAYCLAFLHKQMILPGSCGCPNSCFSQLHRGTCVSKAGMNTCQCEPGWKGADCSVVSCGNSIDPCQNGGKCTTEGGIDVCDCAKGFNLMDCSGRDQVYTQLPNATSPQYEKDEYKDDHPLYDISTVTTVRVYMKEEDLFSLATGPSKTPIEVQSIHIKNNRINVHNNGTIQKSGALSQRFAKKSFRFKFTDEFMKVKSIKLKGAEFDSSFIREAMSIAVARSMGIPVGRSGYAALYINDVFRGVYVLLEDIKKPFLKSRFGTDKGVYCDTKGCEPSGSGHQTPQYVCRDPRSGVANINAIMDADMYLKSVAVDAMTGNWDGWKNRNNFAFYQPKKDAKFVPFRFDLDGSWGFDFWQPQAQSSFDVLQYVDDTLCRSLMKDGGYRATYIAYIKHIADTWLAPKGAAEVFASELHAMLLSVAVQDNWHALDFDHTPQAFLGSLNLDVTKPYKTQAIINFISIRYNTALKQIAGG